MRLTGLFSRVVNWLKQSYLPPIEYDATHKFSNGRSLLLATIVISLIMLPFLVLVNLATQGFELVSSLQPTPVPNSTYPESWWGVRYVPSLLRPDSPDCQPKDIGRADTFRLSPSLFDYRVMSVWNTSESIPATGVRDQERVEYNGQSFSDCFVNNTRFDYSLAEQTQTVTVGVVCPGTNQSYPIFVSMETELVFAQMLSKDFIGQYYGPGLKLMNITHETGSNYQKIVLGALEVISTDSLTIMRNYNTSAPPMSASIIYYVDPNKGTAKYETSTFTHLDGTVELWPTPARVYTSSIENLIYVANHAVNLDLGSTKYPNLFRDISVVPKAILPNPMPPNTSSNQWVGNDSISFYYGALPAGYDSWADALLDGKPFKLGEVTDIPPDSTMVTTYLCSTYQVKPTGALASSVITGILSMGNTAWGIWLIVLALLVTKYQAPVVECLCSECIKKAEDAFQKRKAEKSEEPKNVHPTEEMKAAGNPDSATVINRLLTLEDKIRDLESRLRDSLPGDEKAKFIRFPMEQHDSHASTFSGGANK